MDRDPRDFPPGDLRVSDAERDMAVSELSRAFQAGRLTAEEFEERCGQAFASRTGRELTALLADLPVERETAETAGTAETAVARRPADAPVPAPRVVVGATVAATLFALVSVANAFSHGPTLQQRELARRLFAENGVRMPPLPPATGFNWAGTLVPALISVAFVLLILFLRVARDHR